MSEQFNIIECLHIQIEALLDLIMCADDDCADTKSMRTASEMCLTMLDELMAEVGKIETEYRKHSKEKTK